MSESLPSDPRPVGIFDSGVGGLTVAGAFTRALPGEAIVYLGDTARVPYGSKSPEVVVRYAERCADFLIAQGIKLLIVACNTASAVAIEPLRARLAVPVIGVIEPGADAAVRASKSGRIGVIGTRGTIASGAYRREIAKRRPSAQIFEKACPLFVPLAEEGFETHPATALIAAEYLGEFRAHDIDTLVLGCTHYPILRAAIAAEVGPGVTLCDSAGDVTMWVRRELERGALVARQSADAPRHRFCLTDVQPAFADLTRRFFGADIARDVAKIERVDL